jgi:predicted phage tail component-like protein
MYSPPPPVTTSDPTATTGTGTTGTTQTTQPVSIDPTNEVYGTIDITQYPQLKQARSFTFNGMDSRYFGFLINKITRPFFPPLTVPSVAVPNKAGAIALNRNEWGVRTISIDVTLMGDSWNDLRQKVRNLAGFLVYQTDVPLVFSDEPTLQYFARFNASSTNLDEIAQTGQGTLVFTCFDPLAYSVTEQTHLLDTNGFSYVAHNRGTAPSYPRFDITPTVNCSFIKITNTTTNKSITFNSTWLAGDTLVLDCKNNTVYRDQDKESFIASITLDSEFFPLVAGDNNLVVSNQDPAGAGLTNVARVTWTECYY